MANENKMTINQIKEQAYHEAGIRQKREHEERFAKAKEIARKIDLASFMTETYGIRLHYERGRARGIDNDSLIVDLNTNLCFWNSKSQKPLDIIQFISEQENREFLDVLGDFGYVAPNISEIYKEELAYLLRVNGYNENAKSVEQSKTKQTPVIKYNVENYKTFVSPSPVQNQENTSAVRGQRELILPENTKNNNITLSYLSKTRSIDRSIIEECLQNGSIYQSKNNVVFVGFDKEHHPKYASKRSSLADIVDKWQNIDIYKEDSLANLQQNGVPMDESISKYQFNKILDYLYEEDIPFIAEYHREQGVGKIIIPEEYDDIYNEASIAAEINATDVAFQTWLIENNKLKSDVSLSNLGDESATGFSKIVDEALDTYAKEHNMSGGRKQLEQEIEQGTTYMAKVAYENYIRSHYNQEIDLDKIAIKAKAYNQSKEISESRKTLRFGDYATIQNKASIDTKSYDYNKMLQLVDKLIDDKAKFSALVSNNSVVVTCEREELENLIAQVKSFQSKSYEMRNLEQGMSYDKMDVSGSDKRFSFKIEHPDSKIVQVFEAPIDALSKASMDRQVYGDNFYKRNNYLSLSGISISALEQYLIDHPETEEIQIGTDKDEAGENAVSSVIKFLQSNEQYRNIKLARVVPQSKDWNEDLVNYYQSMSLSRQVEEEAKKIQANLDKKVISFLNNEHVYETMGSDTAEKFIESYPKTHDDETLRTVKKYAMVASVSGCEEQSMNKIWALSELEDKLVTMKADNVSVKPFTINLCLGRSIKGSMQFDINTDFSMKSALGKDSKFEKLYDVSRDFSEAVIDKREYENRILSAILTKSKHEFTPIERKQVNSIVVDEETRKKLESAINEKDSYSFVGSVMRYTDEVKQKVETVLEIGHASKNVPETARESETKKEESEKSEQGNSEKKKYYHKPLSEQENKGRDSIKAEVAEWADQGRIYSVADKLRVAEQNLSILYCNNISFSAAKKILTDLEAQNIKPFMKVSSDKINIGIPRTVENHDVLIDTLTKHTGRLFLDTKIGTAQLKKDVKRQVNFAISDQSHLKGLLNKISKFGNDVGVFSSVLIYSQAPKAKAFAQHYHPYNRNPNEYNIQIMHDVAKSTRANDTLEQIKKDIAKRNESDHDRYVFKVNEEGLYSISRKTNYGGLQTVMENVSEEQLKELLYSDTIGKSTELDNLDPIQKEQFKFNFTTQKKREYIDDVCVTSIITEDKLKKDVRENTNLLYNAFCKEEHEKLPVDNQPLKIYDMLVEKIRQVSVGNLNKYNEELVANGKAMLDSKTYEFCKGCMEYVMAEKFYIPMRTDFNHLAQLANEIKGNDNNSFSLLTLINKRSFNVINYVEKEFYKALKINTEPSYDTQIEHNKDDIQIQPQIETELVLPSPDKIKEELMNDYPVVEVLMSDNSSIPKGKYSLAEYDELCKNTVAQTAIKISLKGEQLFSTGSIPHHIEKDSCMEYISENANEEVTNRIQKALNESRNLYNSFVQLQATSPETEKVYAVDGTNAVTLTKAGTVVEEPDPLNSGKDKITYGQLLRLSDAKTDSYAKFESELKKVYADIIDADSNIDISKFISGKGVLVDSLTGEQFKSIAQELAKIKIDTGNKNLDMLKQVYTASKVVDDYLKDINYQFSYVNTETICNQMFEKYRDTVVQPLVSEFEFPGKVYNKYFEQYKEDFKNILNSTSSNIKEFVAMLSKMNNTVERLGDDLRERLNDSQDNTVGRATPLKQPNMDISHNDVEYSR